MTHDYQTTDYSTKEKKISTKRFQVGLVSALALLFIWSIAGTITLRYLLILASIALLAPALNFRGWIRTKGIAIPLYFLGLLSLWFVAQAVFVSPETSWALGELQGQWAPALVAFILGLLLAEAAHNARNQRGTDLILLGIVCIFSVQAMIAIAQTVHSGLSTGNVFQLASPPRWGKLERSFIFNILLAFLSVDLLARSTGRARIIPVPLGINIACILLALLALYFAGARNGIIALVFLSISCAFFYVYEKKEQLGALRSVAIGLTVLLLVAGFSYASYKADARWKVFLETAEIAWDIDTYDSWKRLDGPLPLLASGAPVDHSAYMRISWLHVGERLLQENPLGVGYGRNAFRHALARHSEVQLGHAHSGFVDLAVAAGVPALILWLAFIGSLIGLGWKALVSNEEALPGLLLILVSTGFTGRMVLDSVNRDHMLQIFLFLSGVLLILIHKNQARSQQAIKQADAS